MSDFSDLLTETGEALHMLTHGDDSRFTYTPPNGSAASCRAAIGPETAVRSTEAPGTTIGYERSVTIPVSLLASPHLEGSVTIDDVSYAITGLDRSSGGNWEISLFRRAAIEVTRDSYRRTR